MTEQQKLWSRVHAVKPRMPHFLSAVSIDGLRGIEGLRVTFDYPVTVVAGGNGSGKSTVLLAAACAYKVPGAGVRDFVPSTLFPDFRANVGDRRDDRGKVAIDFEYKTPDGGRSMRWRRSKSWTRSFFGRRGATQPERQVYLRTLTGPTKRSETGLRLSEEIAHLKEGLVLADQVEAGLHPWDQHLLMLRLQELALQNNVQVIVTSHSPVVLNSVPDLARVFLERDEEGSVSVVREYSDIVQDAIYGRSPRTLYVLCENSAAETVLLGLVDHLALREGLDRQSIKVGRDNDEFPRRARVLREFGQIDNVVFVLNGDRRGQGDEIRDAAQQDVPIFFLAGDLGPEAWVWGQLRRPEVAAELGVEASDLAKRTTHLDVLFDDTVGKASERAWYKLKNLAEYLDTSIAEVCRVVALLEAERRASDVQPLMSDLAAAVNRWRSRR